MKQTVQLDKIQERMEPGRITLEGFLGPDKRNLVEILIEDDAAVKKMGIEHKDIAEKMMELRNAAYGGLGDFIDVPPNFKVKVETYRGKLPCPFGDPGIFPKINTTVKNTKIKKEIHFSDLQIHMIGTHGFYEGKGHKFRIEPALAAEVLEIEAVDEDLFPK